ncbi:hypothetical protein DICA3_F18470 [Diutina catenulata]
MPRPTYDDFESLPLEELFDVVSSTMTGNHRYANQMRLIGLHITLISADDFTIGFSIDEIGAALEKNFDAVYANLLAKRIRDLLARVIMNARSMMRIRLELRSYYTSYLEDQGVIY